ncbi:VapE domain-containing protein [uncultured Gemella sp.]|uniref:VapE domain-containing protein n=1 Tax=uncultured Gemella sp. TaxID=254352 RepID=UPI0028D24EEE|nr:VapE domain-containing protein [uncultured Gemella sp.]
MIYRQIGLNTSKLKLIKHSFNTPLEVLANTPLDVVSENEDLEKYKSDKSLQFLSGDITPNEDGSYTRNDSNVNSRDLIVIDIEKTGLNSQEVQNIIQEKLASYKYYLYSTISHEPNNPRLRLVLEPNREILEDEYKPTIQHVMALVGVNYDTKSYAWSQPQGLPIEVEGKETVSIKQLEGEAYPVQEAVKEEKKVIATYSNEPIKKIPHDQAISIMEKYIDNEKNNLLERNNNYLSCLTVIAKSVVTGEIEYDTAIVCIEMLALGNEEWKENNVKELNGEIKRANGSIEYFKNDYTFKSKFEKTQQGIQVTNAVTQEKMKISTNENGKVIQTLVNLEKIILSIVPVSYNELTHAIEIVNKQGETTNYEERERNLIRMDIEKRFKIKAKNGDIDTAVTCASDKFRYHPIKSKILSEEWDGIPRAESFFIDVLGVEDNVYNRECTRKWLLAGIYRLFEPGTKFDEMLIIHGDQGLSKSTTFKKLALNFYVSETERLSLETLIKIELAWIVDFTELATMKKTDIDTFKAWLSETSDTYRGKYDKKARVHERHFIICGTTNDKEILTDRTGNRRYWLMYGDEENRKMNIFDIEEDYILQLWSEVYQWYKNRETLLISNETKLHMRKLTSDALEYNPLEERINIILEMLVPKNWIEYFKNGANRFKFYKYVNEFVNFGTVDESIPQETQIQDITSYELGYLIGEGEEFKMNLGGSKLAKDINKVMNNLPNWEKSNKIDRNGKKVNGFKRKNKDLKV